MTILAAMLAAQRGNSSVVVALANQTLSDTVASGDTASCDYDLTSSGDVENTLSSGTIDLGDWITPKASAGSGYEARATVNSGSVSGTTGSWLSLGTGRSWSVSNASPGSTVSANITVEIRNATTLAVLASASVSLAATVNP